MTGRARSDWRGGRDRDPSDGPRLQGGGGGLRGDAQEELRGLLHNEGAQVKKKKIHFSPDILQKRKNVFYEKKLNYFDVRTKEAIFFPQLWSD